MQTPKKTGTQVLEQFNSYSPPNFSPMVPRTINVMNPGLSPFTYEIASLLPACYEFPDFT